MFSQSQLIRRLALPLALALLAVGCSGKSTVSPDRDGWLDAAVDSQRERDLRRCTTDARCTIAPAQELSDMLRSASFTVALDGDRLLLGAAINGEHGGYAYAYRHDGTRWVQQQELMASDASWESAFGAAVAIRGPRALVGAPEEDERGSETGAVYVYALREGRWLQEAKLTPPDPVPHDGMGLHVGISQGRPVVALRRYIALHAKVDGNWVVIHKLLTSGYASRMAVTDHHLATAYSDPASSSSTVTIHAITGTGFREQASFQVDEPYPTIALHGDLLAVGAGGKITFYRRSGVAWLEAGTLPSSGPPREGFGATLALTETALVVGIQPPLPAAGSLLLYERIGDSWRPTADLKIAGVPQLMLSRVALSENWVAVTGRRTTDAGSSTPLAVVFPL